MAPAVLSFLRENDLSGKRVIPFQTHAGWPGHGLKDIEEELPGAVVEKGKKAFLMIVGIVIGWVGKLAGIPTDLLGVSWFGDFFAMLALGVGSIVIGVINDNGFVLSLFGHSASLFSGIFPEGFSSSAMITYMPHGVMIGAGAVSLIQCAVMLMKKGKNGTDTSATGRKYTRSMNSLKKPYIIIYQRV